MITNQTSKFSYVENDELFQELQGFIKWLSCRECNPENIMMSYDDVKQELEIELMKGLAYYKDKPVEQRKALVKRMLDNRIGELRHKFYGTYRRLGNNSLQIEDMDECLSDMSTTEADSHEFVEDLMSKLSPESRKVLETILFPSDKMANTLSLAALRAGTVKRVRNRKPWYLIQPWHVAEVLGMDLKKCKLCFSEIKTVYDGG